METQREHQLLRKKWKELNVENQRLKQEIISLKEQLDVSPAATAHKTNGITTELELVKTLAKKYTALYEPFSKIYIDPNLFVLPRPESKCLLPEERFCTNLTARRDGWLAQLYDFLPENLHSMVRGHSNFDIEACGDHHHHFYFSSECLFDSFELLQKICVVLSLIGCVRQHHRSFSSIQTSSSLTLSETLSLSSSASSNFPTRIQKRVALQSSHQFCFHQLFDERGV